MNDADLWPVPGDTIEPDELSIPKARELARVLLSGVLDWVSFVSATRDGEREFVVLDIEPEVPQQPVKDIRGMERIAVKFEARDRKQPDPLALRRDFPDTSHQNLRLKEGPKSLCLFEESYREQKLQWTASKLLRQLHHWLGRTALNLLHQDDQPLEHLLLGAPEHLILPTDLFEVESDEEENGLLAFAWENRPERWTLIATRDGGSVPKQAPPVVPVIVCQVTGSFTRLGDA
jgi:hypothetical protein